MSQNIESFINETFTPYHKQILMIAPIDSAICDILKSIGIEPEGYCHAVDRYGLMHALKEHERDELPLTLEDFLKIPVIVTEYDVVVRSYKTELGLDAVLYTKQFEDTFYYVEEIRTGRKQLIFKTMYKKRTGLGASTADHP